MATPAPCSAHVPEDNAMNAVCGCWMISCLRCYEETREMYQEWIEEYEAGLL